MKNLLFILPLLFSVNIIAIPPIRNAELSNAVATAEEFEKDNNYLQAAAKLLEAINITNSEAVAELKEFKDKWAGPYKLELYSKRFWYLKRSYQQKSPTFGAEVQTVINEYKKEAKGKNWNAYKWLYMRLADYYRANDNEKEAAKIYEKRYLYSPTDKKVLLGYLYYLLKTNPAKIDPIIKRYIAEGGEWYSKLAFLNCKKIQKQGGDPFDALIKMLEDYPSASFREFKDAMNMLCMLLDPEKPEQLKKYYKTLTALALKQPSDSEHLQNIGLILNEKKKIETIMPEIK